MNFSFKISFPVCASRGNPAGRKNAAMSDHCAAATAVDLLLSAAAAEDPYCPVAAATSAALQEDASVIVPVCRGLFLTVALTLFDWKVLNLAKRLGVGDHWRGSTLAVKVASFLTVALVAGIGAEEYCRLSAAERVGHAMVATAYLSGRWARGQQQQQVTGQERDED
jgi:hypothetical protein